MNEADLNTTLINSYFELFKKLSVRGKEQLIEKLNKSLRVEMSEKSDTFFSTFGALKGKESAEELIEIIRNSRNFNRNTAEF